MRYIPYILFALLLPSLAFATPSSVDRITDHIEPLIKTDFIRAPYFTATSATQASTFPFASTTAISSSKLTNGNCVQAAFGGLLTTVGVPCSTTSGTVTQINTTYPILGGPITNTGTISLAFGTTTSNIWAGTQTFTNSPVFSTLTAGTVNSTAAGTIYNTATSSLSVSAPLGLTGTPGALIGGTNLTITCASCGSGSVTSITAGTGLLGGIITTSGTITNTLATSSIPVIAGLPYWTNSGASSGTALLGNVSTTTHAFSGPFTISGTIGALVGGSNSTVTWTGLATTTQPTLSQLLYSTGGAGVAGVSTTTLSGSGVISVTAGASTLGSAPITISCATCGTGSVTSITTSNGVQGGTITTTGNISLISYLATSTAEIGGQLAVWGTTNGTPAKLYSIGTSTLTASSPLTGSFTQIGSGGSLGCQTASGSQAGCLSSADWTTFNGKLSTAVTSIGPAGQLQTGPAVTLATSTTAFNGITAGDTIVGSGNTITFKPNWSGSLNVAGGGTGLTSVADGALLFGGLGGAAANLVALATSTAGFLSESYTTGRPVWNATSTLNIALSDTTGTLAIARGGTNNSSAYTAGSAIYSNGTSLTQDNANFFWDGTNHRLGIGTVAPQVGLDVLGTASSTKFFANAGTASAPTYSFAGNTNYGIFNDTTKPVAVNNGVAVTVNGSEEARFVPNFAGNGGAVLIGTTTQDTNAASNFVLYNNNPASMLFHANEATGNGAVFYLQNDTQGYVFQNMFGSMRSGTSMGMSNADLGLIGTSAFSGSAPSALAIGTFSAAPLVFGTNGVDRLHILSTGNIGIATSSPQSALTVNGDIGTDGLPPVVTLCGTGAALTTGSTDTAGEVTEGTLATGCTITFKTAKTFAPFCTSSSEAGLAFSFTQSTAAITITNIGALSSTKIDWLCVQNNR